MDNRPIRERLGAQSSLLRTKGGRVVVPALDDLNYDHNKMAFTEADLDAIHAELMRRRRNWRIKAFLFVSGHLAFWSWSFFWMPRAAFHLWPFN